MCHVTTLQEKPSGYKLYWTNIPHWPIFALVDSPEVHQIVFTVLGTLFDGFFKVWDVRERAWVSNYYTTSIVQLLIDTYGLHIHWFCPHPKQTGQHCNHYHWILRWKLLKTPGSVSWSWTQRMWRSWLSPREYSWPQSEQKNGYHTFGASRNRRHAIPHSSASCSHSPPIPSSSCLSSTITRPISIDSDGS